MTPNISPRSLRESAFALRTYAECQDDELAFISPVLLESRRVILDSIADELEAIASEREVRSKGWRGWLDRTSR